MPLKHTLAAIAITGLALTSLAQMGPGGPSGMGGMPSTGPAESAPGTGAELRARMQAHERAMQDLRSRALSASSAEERQALMEEHMRLMEQGMVLMRQMMEQDGAAAPPASGSSGGSGMPGSLR